MKKLPKLRPKTALVFETLDQRLLYSADLAGVVAAVVPDQSTPAEVRYVAQTSSHTELVVIDSRVNNASSIEIKPGQEALIVDASETFFDALARWNAAQSNPSTIDALHLVAHGQDGSMQLGREAITSASLRNNAESWAQLGLQMQADADILIYACDFAASARGEETVQLMAELTHADVAASNDLSGAASLGANWTLEFHTGAINAVGLFTENQHSDLGTLTSLTLEVVGTATATDSEELTRTGRGDQLATNGTQSVIVWQDAISHTIVARLADANGVQSPTGIVVATSSKTIADMAVAMGADGRFAVTWIEQQSTSNSRVYLQRFNADGSSLGSKEQIDDGSSRLRQGTTIAIDGNNKLAVAWLNAGLNDTTMANSTIVVTSESWFTGTFSTQTASAGQTNLSSPVMRAGLANNFVLAWVNNTDNAIYTCDFAQNGTIGAPTVAVAAVVDNVYSDLSIAIGEDGTSALAYHDVIATILGPWSVVKAAYFATGNLTGPSLSGDYSQFLTARIDPSIASNGNGGYTVVFTSHSQPAGTANPEATTNLWAVSSVIAQAAPGLAPTLTAAGSPIRLNPTSSPWLTVARNASSQFIGNELFIAFDGLTTASFGSYDAILRFQLSPPALLVSPVSNAFTTESGGTSTFTVALNGRPAGNVTVSVSSLNTAEGQVSSPTTLTFTTANWNVAQTVSITGGPSDNILDGTQGYQIRLVANDTETDPLFSYNNLTQTVSLANQDTDTFNRFIVTSTADVQHLANNATAADYLSYARSNPSGVTLRDAIIVANNAPNGTGGMDQIHFAAALKNQTISLLSALPNVIDKVDINGNTGSTTVPEVTIRQDSSLSGSSGANFSALTLMSGSANSQIQYLAFAGFVGNAAAVEIDSDNITVNGNWFGIDTAGAVLRNNSDAIQANGSNADSVVGLVISNNRIASSLSGINLQFAAAASIWGNKIGATSAAETGYDNWSSGIRVSQSTDTYIHDNVILQNSGNGVQIALSTNTRIENNQIGQGGSGSSGVEINNSTSTIVSQNQLSGNGGDGIHASLSSNVNILANTIVSNGANGIHLFQVATASVGGNKIGVSSDGITAMGNALNGILIEVGSSALSIGNNTISANGSSGMYLSGASSSTIYSNVIGLNSAQNQALGNGGVIASGGPGITISGNSQNNQLYDNVVAGNINGGIRISGSNTSGNRVYRNFVGTNASQSANFSNGAEGISLYDGTHDNTIGSVVLADGNTINETQGIRIFSSGSGNNATNNALLSNTLTGAIFNTTSLMTGDWNTSEQTPALVNDPLDTDWGNNGFSNTPVFTSLQALPANNYQAGISLQGMANTTYLIEFNLVTPLTSNTCQTARPVSQVSVTTGADGQASVSTTLSIPGGIASTQRLVATSTRMVGSSPQETSAYSAPANQAIIVLAQNGSVAELTSFQQVLSASDPEGGAITWTIVSQSVPGALILDTAFGGGARLLFSNAAPFYGNAPDAEDSSAPANNTYSITLLATDNAGFSTSRQIDITVTNVVEPPVILNALAVQNFAENFSGEIVDLATALTVKTDLSATGPLSYSIVPQADTDYGLFAMDTTSIGKVLLQTAQDFENPAHVGGSYSLLVRITDSVGGTVDQMIDMQIMNVNEAAVIGGSLNNSVAENSPATQWQLSYSAGNVGSTYTWSLAAGDDSSKFNIDPLTGLLAFNYTADFEVPTDSGSDNVYSATVYLTDQYGQSTNSTVNVTITDVNEAPTIAANTGYIVAENGSALTWQQYASDPDSADQLTWSISGGADQAKFTIDAATGLLHFLPIADFEAPQDANGDNQYEVQLQVTDTGANSKFSNVFVSIINVNEAPLITTANTLSSNENAVDPEWALTATDPESGSAVQWTIVGGADAGRFSIDAGSNQLQLNMTPNFEAPADANGDNYYSVIVQVTDSGGLSSQRQFDVKINNVNESPVTSASQTYTISENQANLSWTHTATDQDAGDQLSWSISGGADAALFTINSLTGTLQFSGPANFEVPVDAGANNSYNVELQVSDSAGSTATTLVTVLVTDVNETPAITTPSAQTVAENTNTPTFSLLATDEEGSNALVWSIVGGADSTSFSINAATGALQLNLTPNFESPADADLNNVYSVIVKVTDAGGLTAQRQFDVQVTNLNESPFTSGAATYSASENSTGLVWTQSAVDPDTGELLTWSIVGGTDAAKFTLNATTGTLQFNEIANYEAPVDVDANNSYLVELQVTDTAGQSANKLVTLLITNVNEAPVFVTPNANSVAENTVSPSWNLQATDPDAASILQWSIVGGSEQSHFSINSTTGALQLNLTPNFETPVDANQDNSYSVLVQAIDEGGLAIQRQFDFQVSDVNEPPVITSVNAFTLNENTVGVFQLVARDPDAGPPPSFSIVGGADAALFALNATNGKLKFTGAAATAGVDFESAHGPTYSIVVRATDANGGQFVEQTISVNIADLNEPISLTAPASLTSAEDVAIGFGSNSGHAITLQDADRGQSYQLSATASNGMLRSNGVDTASLTLTGSLAELQAQIAAMEFMPNPNFYGNASLAIQLQEQLAGGNSASQTIALTITPTDDPLIVVRQTSPTLTAGNSMVISSSTLTLQDNDVSASNIVFRLSTTPTAVTLLHGTTVLVAGDTFTQADIDAGLIQVSSPINTSTGVATIALQAKDSSSQAVPLDVNLQVNTVSSAGPAVTTTTGLGTSPSSTTTAAATTSASSSTAPPIAAAAQSAPQVVIASPTEKAAAGTDISTVDTNAAATESAKAQRAAAAASTLKSNNNAAPTITAAANQLAASIQFSSANNAIAQLAEGEKQGSTTTTGAAVRELGSTGRSFTSSEDRDARKEALRSVEFTRDIDNIRREVQQEMTLERAVVGSSVAVTTSVSIGYVIWLLRGGVLLSSLLATLPAWRSLDPFPVLAGAGGHDEPAEDDSLQGMLKRAADKMKANASVEITDKNNEETA